MIESAREIAVRCIDRAREIAMKKIFVDATDEIEALVASALAERDAEIARRVEEMRERCAATAERYGCGKPGCTDCFAGAAAVAIRALPLSPSPSTEESGT